MPSLKIALAALTLALPTLSHAGYLPYGLQSNVTPDTVSNWGWKQCFKWTDYSGRVANILHSCSGDYLMMGLLDNNSHTYAILGAGEFSVVSAWTNTSTSNTTQALDNWSNGLNFYRSSEPVANSNNKYYTNAWGFTTNSVVHLYRGMDSFLGNGYATGEYTGGSPSAGMSFGTSVFYDVLDHTSIYNTTGQDSRYDINTLTKVILSLSGPISNAPPGSTPDPSIPPTDPNTGSSNGGSNPPPSPIPEPSTLALFSLSMGSMGLASRRRREMA